MKCPKCGHDNPKGATNCEECRINLAWAMTHRAEFMPEEEIRVLEERKQEDRRGIFHQQSLRTAWEYYIVPVSCKREHWSIHYQEQEFPQESLSWVLGDLGDDGWELVGAISSVGTGKELFLNTDETFTYQHLLLFKRPKKAW